MIYYFGTAEGELSFPVVLHTVLPDFVGTKTIAGRICVRATSHSATHSPISELTLGLRFRNRLALFIYFVVREGKEQKLGKQMQL